jgi:hypothetical protein
MTVEYFLDAAFQLGDVDTIWHDPIVRVFILSRTDLAWRV